MRVAALAFLVFVACGSDEERCNPEFRAVDTARMCLGPMLAEPCYPTPGPPSISCSVASDGTVYISGGGRLYPGARACNDSEMRQFSGASRGTTH